MDAELFEVHRKLMVAANRAELIAAADAQIQAFADNPEYYVLPNVYKWAKPLLENFGQDPEGWLDFVRNIVDSFPKRSDERIELKQAHRKLESRIDQQIRRRRVKLAMDAYKQRHGEFPDKDVEARYAKDIFGLWKAQRQIILGKLTRSHPRGKASAEERRDACADFWQTVESQLAAGLVPGVDDLQKQIQHTAGLYELVFGKPLKS